MSDINRLLLTFYLSRPNARLTESFGQDQGHLVGRVSDINSIFQTT
jgi:hypothetical protein